MASSLKFQTFDPGLVQKIKALDAASGQGLYEAIGASIKTQVNLGFKMARDPWGNSWPPIKWRAPRVRQRTFKDAAGNASQKNLRGKDGLLKLTKVGKLQHAANTGGTPGQPLRDTGKFQRSITYVADDKGVTVGTNATQARIHQFGGVIRPKNKKFLVFPGPDGELIFAKKVTIRARPYLPILPGHSKAILPPAWSKILVARLKAYLSKAAKAPG